jgi:hypothetical protein
VVDGKLAVSKYPSEGFNDASGSELDEFENATGGKHDETINTCHFLRVEEEAKMCDHDEKQD